MAQTTEVVDIAFPCLGQSVPLDHGYALFGALSRILPGFHEEKSAGIHSIRGKAVGPTINLLPSSCLRLRVRSASVGLLFPLIDTTLELDGHKVRLGPPRVFPLRPASALKAHIVTIKNHQERASFLSAIRQQISAVPELGQTAETIDVVIPAPAEGTQIDRARRVIRIAGKNVVGFTVGLEGLTADASLALQTHGLGGRRHMGAGLFLPAKR